MTSVLGGVAMPHAPQFFTLPETEDEETVDKVRSLAEEVGGKLAALKRTKAQPRRSCGGITAAKRARDADRRSSEPVFFPIRYADDVRHITWRWIPFAERRGLEEMTPGPTAHPAAKAKGDSSMPSKRERPEDAYGPVPQGPCDRVRTGLFEPQPPAMQAYIPRHSVFRRGHRDRAAKSSSPEPSTRWAMGDNPIQGGGRGTYVALDTSSTKGMWDRPPRREAQGDGAAVVLRGRESRPHGEGRQVS
jgi:hypothetical protein